MARRSGDVLENFMYLQTLKCVDRIDPTHPDYVALTGTDMIQYIAEAMADIVDAVKYGYSIETSHKLSATLLAQYPLVAALGLDTFALSGLLYKTMLTYRKHKRETDFDEWVHDWTRRCEEDQDLVDVGDMLEETRL